MRVPGALAAVAGVTLVGVLPTHRRRGILSSLMRWQPDDLHDRSEAVAALFPTVPFRGWPGRR
jgi:predicted acetyltransferase